MFWVGATVVVNGLGRPEDWRSGTGPEERGADRGGYR